MSSAKVLECQYDFCTKYSTSSPKWKCQTITYKSGNIHRGCVDTSRGTDKDGQSCQAMKDAYDKLTDDKKKVAPYDDVDKCEECEKDECNKTIKK